ncbi:class II glutamine amidotransferase [Kineococcus sp. T13]|uniref:class II glutamine amidotransferase n=1 Tax=Kineococcus vitellinus TaxID=2696565 RepID=UPI0014128502|nr:class II glutamine amidotransferase [Kineococcus vitellinus]
MCRLLAHAAPRPTTFAELIGPEQLAAFRTLSCLHADGWGTAWLDGAGDGAGGGPRVRRVRDALPVQRSRRGSSALSQRPSTARLVHLRLATSGMAVGHENSHPFLHGGIAFAHNGSVPSLPLLEELVGPQHLAQVGGTTDSERIFALVRRHADAGADLAGAAAAAVLRLREALPAASLNAVLLSAEELVVVHSSESAPVPLEELCATGLAPAQLPLDHAGAYYRMSWLRRPDGAVVFTSAGIDTTGWQALPPASITTVRLDTLQVRVQDLAAAAAAVPAR